MPRACRVAVCFALLAWVTASGCGGTVVEVGNARSVQPSDPRPPSAPAVSPPAPTANEPLEPPVAHSPLPIERSHAPWALALRRALGRTRGVSVAVGTGGRIVFTHNARVPRIPASNQKLLTTMAALETFGPRHRFATVAASLDRARRGVIRGDLRLVGGGDPELDASALEHLASRIERRGVRRITGSIVGDRRAFDRGWWAPGWIRDVSRRYVARTTALAFEGSNGSDPPEIEAATSLTASLRHVGIVVEGPPKAGGTSRRLRPLAAVRSAPLTSIVERQNHGSINFDAEMMTKALDAQRSDGPGSTAGGARAIESWAANLGTRAVVFDGSGLSHRNRASAVDLVTLLVHAYDRPWWPALFRSLPSSGEGTLAGRLAGVDVRAKTGTLFVTPVSALSGYVRDAGGSLVAFSVLSRGTSKAAATVIEDSVVRTIAAAHIGSVELG